MIEINETWMYRSICAWNYSQNDFYEVAQQLYAQMIGLDDYCEECGETHDMGWA